MHALVKAFQWKIPCDHDASMGARERNSDVQYLEHTKRQLDRAALATAAVAEKLRASSACAMDV
eukprot:scaffold87674_cov45-Prasinocladus_malaysianus.AAC.1